MKAGSGILGGGENMRQLACNIEKIKANISVLICRHMKIMAESAARVRRKCQWRNGINERREDIIAG